MRIKMVATGEGFLCACVSIFLAMSQSFWWLAIIPLVVITWVFNPRWDRQKGWRFLHR